MFPDVDNTPSEDFVHFYPLFGRVKDGPKDVVDISARALALSVQQYRAMRRPQFVGQATRMYPRLFYVDSLNLIKLVQGTYSFR